MITEVFFYDKIIFFKFYLLLHLLDSNKLYLEDFNDNSLINIELFIILLQKDISAAIEIDKNIQKVILNIF
jgi:hypothetical protein